MKRLLGCLLVMGVVWRGGAVTSRAAVVRFQRRLVLVDLVLRTP